MDGESLELFRIDERSEGGTFRSVVLSRLADGAIRVDAQDMGEPVEKIWHDSDYEFWVDVPTAAVAKLAFVLLRERFMGRAGAVDELTALCKREGIEHKWGSWA
ncbi:MAG: hypothetical protein KGJ41_16785 [Rhodospirillales bacterium]|nr:hypothetical protein [Rhodospirillales bacterium]MDE2200670.1 hypothetical protein [Rhodospirillales bacterium]MDE2573958.1 hypothetical protein [Rhodospirillales bacterium]